MSRLEIVQRAYAAFESGELGDLLPDVDPEIELAPIVGSVSGETYLGHAGLRAWRADLTDSFGAFHNEDVEMRELGDRVLVRSRFCAEGRGSGASIAAPAIAVFDFRDGRIFRYAAHLAPDAALLRELGWNADAA